MKTLVSLAFILRCIASANADALVYEFSGVLPAGASINPLVLDGESWIATFFIDTSVVDIDDSTARGVYPNSALGAIEFSGGYSQNLGPFTTHVAES